MCVRLHKCVHVRVACACACQAASSPNLTRSPTHTHSLSLSHTHTHTHTVENMRLVMREMARFWNAGGFGLGGRGGPGSELDVWRVGGLHTYSQRN